MVTTAGSVPDAGDVLWVDFGRPVGREQAGRRPALVLTSMEYNRRSSVIVVCPITRTERDWPFAVGLPPLGSLSGFVLVDQIKVIDPSIRVFRKAGRIPAETFREVRGRLATLLGIILS